MSFFDAFLELGVRIFWSMWISIGFALLFNTPRRALWITGLLGGMGWGIKFMLLETLMPGQIVITSFLGACAVGLLAVYFAHRVHTPPIVFTIPAVINMIPGKFGYEFMMNIIKIVTIETPREETLDLLFKTIKLGLQTGFILFRTEQEFKQIVVCKRKCLCVIHFLHLLQSLCDFRSKMAGKMAQFLVKNYLLVNCFYFFLRESDNFTNITKRIAHSKHRFCRFECFLAGTFIKGIHQGYG